MPLLFDQGRPTFPPHTHPSAEARSGRRPLRQKLHLRTINSWPCLIPSGLSHPHPCSGVRAVTPGPWMLYLVLCTDWTGRLLSCMRPQQVSRNAFQTCPAPQHLLKKLLRTYPGTVVDPSPWPLAGHGRDRALPSQSSVLGPSRRNRSLAVPPTPTTSESITPPTTVVTQMMLSLE